MHSDIQSEEDPVAQSGRDSMGVTLSAYGTSSLRVGPLGHGPVLSVPVIALTAAADRVIIIIP
jgi:hypothetical protein